MRIEEPYEYMDEVIFPAGTKRNLEIAPFHDVYITIGHHASKTILEAITNVPVGFDSLLEIYHDCW